VTVRADPIFTLRNRAEILAIVERVKSERALTTVEFADGHAFLSNILEVRRDANVLVFDIAREAEQNRRLFASPALGFVTELDHVQIAFETAAASLVNCADGPAAVVEVPSAVIRLQRREWFRADLPTQPPVRCTVLDEVGNATPAKAIDLSSGGAALLVDEALLGQSLPGSDHELILSLPEVGRIELEATLRSVLRTGSSADRGAATLRAGFRFEDVPPRLATRIQRYVQHLEVTHLRVLRRRD